jgi:hypothetical protein
MRSSWRPEEILKCSLLARNADFNRILSCALQPYRTYAHSESRKSPTVDGVVERNRFGRERRQTERLTAEESSFSALVTTCFKQTVCGFDILRDGSKSYVIDVNDLHLPKNT